jgi:hypothetical protein
VIDAGHRGQHLALEALGDLRLLVGLIEVQLGDGRGFEVLHVAGRVELLAGVLTAAAGGAGCAPVSRRGAPDASG